MWCLDHKGLFVLSFFAVYAFGLNVFPITLIIASLYVFCLPFLFLSIPLYNKGQLYGKLLILLSLFLFINEIGCKWNRGQDIMVAYSGTEMKNFMMLNVYFILLHIRCSVKSIEKFLLYFSIFFCAVYIIQYFIYPSEIIRGLENAEYMTENGVIRIRLFGQLMSPLAIFMGINKYLQNRRYIYVCQSILGFVVILMLGFRTQIAVLILCLLFGFYRMYGFSGKTLKILLLGGVVLLVLFIYVPFVYDAVMIMIERNNNDQSFSNSDYIRILNFNYFTTNFWNNNWEMIMGAGLPGDIGHYGNFIDKLKTQGFIFADWGLIGLSWVAGIPVALLLILILLKGIILKLPNGAVYVSMTFLFLILGSILSREVYRIGNMYLLGILLVLHEKIYKSLNINKA